MRNPEELGLSRGEWSVILDVMNGHLIHRDAKGDRIMSAKDEILPDVHYALKQTEFPDQNYEAKWKINAEAMLAKLYALPEDDWEVIIEVVEGYWSGDDNTKRRIPGDPV